MQITLSTPKVTMAQRHHIVMHQGGSNFVMFVVDDNTFGIVKMYMHTKDLLSRLNRENVSNKHQRYICRTQYVRSRLCVTVTSRRQCGIKVRMSCNFCILNNSVVVVQKCQISIVVPKLFWWDTVCEVDCLCTCIQVWNF